MLHPFTLVEATRLSEVVSIAKQIRGYVVPVQFPATDWKKAISGVNDPMYNRLV